MRVVRVQNGDMTSKQYHIYRQKEKEIFNSPTILKDKDGYSTHCFHHAVLYEDGSMGLVYAEGDHYGEQTTINIPLNECQKIVSVFNDPKYPGVAHAAQFEFFYANPEKR